MNDKTRNEERDVTFKVTGRADWETHALMMKALLMIKGVKRVQDRSGIDFDDEEPKTCAEAKEAFEKDLHPRPPYLILADLKITAQEVVDLADRPHPTIASWNTMLARKLADIQRLVKEYDAMVEFHGKEEGEEANEF
jgi:hypothetical protein